LYFVSFYDIVKQHGKLHMKVRTTQIYE
jgi:hypothetical protein